MTIMFRGNNGAMREMHLVAAWHWHIETVELVIVSEGSRQHHVRGWRACQRTQGGLHTFNEPLSTKLSCLALCREEQLFHLII